MLDWPAGRANWPTDATLTDQQAFDIEHELRDAIYHADLFWWLVPDVDGSQSHAEFIIAESMGAKLITSGSESARVRYVYRPQASTHYSTEDLALAYVVELARAA